MGHPRKEFWIFVLCNFIICVVLSVFVAVIGRTAPESATGVRTFGAIYSLSILVPFTAVQVRRLHDTNRSGWWLLIGVIPLVGEIVLLLFMIQESDSGDNHYGAIHSGANRTIRRQFEGLGISLVNNHQGRGINVGFGRGSGISNDDIPALVPLGLHELYLSRTGIGDESIASLGAMNQLRVLDVSSTNFSRDGIRQLKESLPHAKITG
jgi:uncharacterized membrane protein YhaH (DUF805 family)